MPIQITLRGGLYAPVVVCDYCGKEIDNANNGNYEWLVDDKAQPEGKVFFTHKGCSIPHEQRIGRHLMNMPLNVFFVYLSNNAHVDRSKAEETARICAQL